MNEIIRLFPKPYQPLLQRYIQWEKVQEIRIRINKSIEVLDHRGYWLLPGEAIGSLDTSYILNQVSEFSLYRLQDELKEGYITIEGGHRIGLAGKTNTSQNCVENLKYISFMNIRIARQSEGQVQHYLPHIFQKGRWLSTMIVGPPHSGKTTLLRELAQIIGSSDKHRNASKVGIVDERSEIAACMKGIPQLEVGDRTDVMDGCPKAEGMMMMIRSMSPEVLIVDEIGGKKDAEAIREAFYTGVQVMCSVHGTSFSSIQRRPSVKELVDHQVFERYVILDRMVAGMPKLGQVLDERGINLTEGRAFI